MTTEWRKIMKVAVIGAGTMGSGIAQAFAQCDAVEKVYLCDIKTEFAEGGLAKIKKGFDKRIAKGKMEQADADKIVAKIQTGLNEICADADLVVEAALEVMDIKKNLFKELEENIVKNPDCIFASNTSSLSITEIGAGLPKPVVGMHFFNPAPVMKLVEVIAGINTPEETVEKVKEISVQLGKTPVQVNESAGFVVNRILIPLINEGIFVYSEGVSDIEGIDTAMKLGCNHPMGPLELGDYVGLDIVLAIMEVLYAETGDSKYRACPLLRKMVRGKKLGVKTGIGFYNYADGNKVPTDRA
jgi:3-hydroxybutyryl-CoA dehydrogenase